VPAHEDDKPLRPGSRAGRGGPLGNESGSAQDALSQVAFLEQEVALLRRRLAETPRGNRALEDRISELQVTVSGLTAKNERLVATLRDARDQILALKEEIDRLAQPPSGFGVFLEAQEDGTVDIFTGGRKLRVAVAPGVDLEGLLPGREVMLNEALNIIAVHGFEKVGEIVSFKELLEDGERALVVGHTDEERVVRLAEPLLDTVIRAGDALLLEPRSGYVYERVPKSEVEDLVLEEVPGRGGAALPAQGAVPRARAASPERRAALRPSRLRQDAHRQGGGELAGQEGR
jgi:proteasome-associated ATPase